MKIIDVVHGVGEKAIKKPLSFIKNCKGKEGIIEVIVEKVYNENVLCYRVIGFWNPVEKKYHLYITNLNVIAILIYPLYRLRWQIELIFKSCKNSLNAAEMPSKNKNIIENLLLSSIVAHLCTNTIFRIGLVALNEEKKWAISFQRVAKVAVILSDHFINFLLHPSQQNSNHLINKIYLFIDEIFDPNYRRRKTSLGRVHKLLGEAVA